MQIQKYKDTNAEISSGLVDGHTHPVWAGDRVHEFAMKLAGASYMEVPYSIYAIYFFQSKQNFLTYIFGATFWVNSLFFDSKGI